MRKRLQHLVEALWSIVLVHSGLWFLLHRLRRPRILVLAYHRVTPAEEASQWTYPERCVSSATFEKQLLALRRVYDFISLEELDAILAGEKRLDRHVALVTFDDGYRDVYEQALPILRRHDIPALAFLSLGFVGERRSFWFDRLAQALQAWDGDRALQTRLHPLLPAPLAAAFEAPAPRVERLRRAVAFLVRLPVRERRALMKRLLPELLPASEQRASEALTWRQVRDMRAQGVRIGAHGCSHTQLTRLSTEETWHEVQESLHGIARGSGGAVDVFAYPHGAVDDEVARCVGDAGVRLAFTLEPRENQPGDDRLRLGRCNVCEDSSQGVTGGFSAARFLCGLSGFLPGATRLGKSSHRRGAARLDLAWTGPQEASARLEPAATARIGSAAVPRSPAPRAERTGEARRL